jgi:hypothetical protein
MVVPNGSTGQRVALAPDPYINNLVLALPFNSESVFSDVSPKSKGTAGLGTGRIGSGPAIGQTTASLPYGVSGVTTTSSGINTFSKYYGNSVFFVGSNQQDDVLQFKSDDFAFGREPWTIEFWMNIPNVTATACWRGVVSIGNGYQTSNNITIYAPRFSSPANTVVVILNTVNPTIGGTTNVNTSQWFHVALCRQINSGIATHGYSTTRLFVNGVEEGNVSDDNTYDKTDLYIGRDQNCVTNNPSDENGRFRGYLQDLRIYKGVAKYTSNFTPPTQIAL